MRAMLLATLVSLTVLAPAATSQARRDPNKVRIHRDVSYVKKWRLTDRQKLDWYIPPAEIRATKKKLPVLVFAHGGSWAAGSKSMRRERLPEFAHGLAKRGVLVAMINYLPRHSTGVGGNYRSSSLHSLKGA